MLKSNISFISKQLLRMLFLLLFVSIIAFALVSLSPIDPVKTNVGQAALGSMSSEQIEKLEQYWGVDTPPIERYLNWGRDFIKGDMGTSLIYRQDVSKVISTKLSYSLILLSFSWIISGVLGFILGIVSAVYQGKLWDKLIKGYCMIISSTPIFWLGLMLLIIFSVSLKWFPIGLSVPIGELAANVTFGDRLIHAILPAVTLSITGISNIALHTREKAIEVLQSEYVLFAKARGESTWQIVKNHLLRNISLPAITLMFASISEIFGGSILVEQIFSYPGLGQTAVTAGLNSDIPLLMGITVTSALIVFSGNLIANVLYGIIDPRLRKGGKINVK